MMMAAAWELPDRVGDEESGGCLLQRLAMQVVHDGMEPCRHRLREESRM